MGDILEGDYPAQFFLHRGYELVGDATGNNQVEVAEIGIHVEREAMRGHAARNMHADGGDFGLLVFIGLTGLRSTGVDTRRPIGGVGIGYSPCASEALDALGGNSKIGACADQNFFQPPHIFDCAQRFAVPSLRWESTQIEDRIANQLARAMKRNIAAAIALEKLYPSLRQQVWPSYYISLLSVATERDYRCVFKEEENVSNPAIFAQINKLLLEAEPGGIVDGAELENRNHL
jgi:hypothetical protein